MENCVSCDKSGVDGVKLPCAKCGFEMFRCKKCRSLSIEYVCSKCGYFGP